MKLALIRVLEESPSSEDRFDLSNAVLDNIQAPEIFPKSWGRKVQQKECTGFDENRSAVVKSGKPHGEQDQISLFEFALGRFRDSSVVFERGIGG